MNQKRTYFVVVAIVFLLCGTSFGCALSPLYDYSETSRVVVYHTHAEEPLYYDDGAFAVKTEKPVYYSSKPESHYLCTLKTETAIYEGKSTEKDYAANAAQKQCLAQHSYQKECYARSMTCDLL